MYPVRVFPRTFRMTVRETTTRYAVFGQFAGLVWGARGVSIVAFLNAERQKYERLLAEHVSTPHHDRDKFARLDASAATLRTLIASIERGDDMGPR